MREIAPFISVLDVYDPVNEEGVTQVEPEVYQQIAKTPDGYKLLVFGVKRLSKRYCKAVPLHEAECDRNGRTATRQDETIITSKIFQYKSVCNRSK